MIGIIKLKNKVVTFDQTVPLDKAFRAVVMNSSGKFFIDWVTLEAMPRTGITQIGALQVIIIGRVVKEYSDDKLPKNIHQQTARLLVGGVA